MSTSGEALIDLATTTENTYGGATMTLLDFLCKWTKGDRNEESRLKGMLCGFFDRDPRTIRNWINRTPDYVKWVLGRIDKEWEEVGFVNYSIFFNN